jgi:Zn-dependent peptidase ImmA (M78 family)
MAHELGHLTMHHVVPSDDPEAQADEFAGEFLTPSATFGPQARRVTFDRLGQLKAHWKISMKAVIKRATVVGAIDDRAAVRLYKQHSARGYNKAEPYPIPPEKPSLVSQAIDVHLSEHDYSVEELAETMRLSPTEFSRDFLGREWQANVVDLFNR